MNYTYLHYEIGLTLLKGIGPRRAKLLLEKFDHPKDIFEVTKKEFCLSTGFNSNIYDQLEMNAALLKAEKIIRLNKELEIETLVWHDENYPRRLRQCDDAPLVLFKKGVGDLNLGNYVAVVGTRDATNYGKNLVKKFTKSIQGSTITVVSGLALGIDTIAHEEALENNLSTIAVLGHGLDRIYPAKNKKLADKILCEGALITEFTPWSIPDRENFPKRNRIVAGISDATIVVESRSRGGSLITAELANDYNRDVFAFPGDVFADRSIGCNRLIAQQKAHLITHGQEFMKIMNWDNEKPKVSVQRPAFYNLTKPQNSIIKVLQEEETPIDVISFKTKMSISELNVELLHLEMSGLIKSLPGKKYAII